MPSQDKRATLAQEHARLLGRFNELLDKDRNTHVSEVNALKQDVLDFLKKLGLSRNPIYSEVENVDFCELPFAGPSRQTMFDAKCYDRLRFLKSRLELAPELVKRRRGTRRREPRKTATEIQREGRIRAIIRKGRTGIRYCKLLDVEGITPPPKWVEDRCPATYTKAYADPQWRKRIQDEKSRLGKLASNE